MKNCTKHFWRKKARAPVNVCPFRNRLFCIRSDIHCDLCCRPRRYCIYCCRPSIPVYGCRYHQCPCFSVHRAKISSLFSAIITENCQEGIYRYFQRVSNFLNIQIITRTYFEYKTLFSRVFFLLSTYANILHKRK